jgi:hypothetical protein
LLLFAAGKDVVNYDGAQLAEEGKKRFQFDAVCAVHLIDMFV